MTDAHFTVLEAHLRSLKSPNHSAMGEEAEALRQALTELRRGCLVCAARHPRLQCDVVTLQQGTVVDGQLFNWMTVE